MKYRRVTFGERVRELRKELDWTHFQLAKRAQISRNYVALIEQDKARNISLAVFIRLARAFAFSPTVFMAMYLEVTE